MDPIDNSSLVIQSDYFPLVEKTQASVLVIELLKSIDNQLQIRSHRKTPTRMTFGEEIFIDDTRDKLQRITSQALTSIFDQAKNESLALGIQTKSAEEHPLHTKKICRLKILGIVFLVVGIALVLFESINGIKKGKSAITLTVMLGGITSLVIGGIVLCCAHTKRKNYHILACNNLLEDFQRVVNFANTQPTHISLTIEEWFSKYTASITVQKSGALV